MLFAYGMNVGGSVVVSHLCGAKNPHGMKHAITTLFISGAAMSVIVTLIGIFISKRLLAAVNTPAEIFADSENYLLIFLTGLLFMYLFNIASGIFTALGDSVTPGIYLIISNILNLSLDILAAKYTSLGVTGLAWATLISQAAAAACAVITLSVKLRKLTVEKAGNAVLYKSPPFSFAMFKMLMKNIVPAMLHSSVSAVGNVLIQGVINPMGTAAIAGCALGGKINGFASSCIDSVPDGNSAFAAQNIGGGRTERVVKGFRAGLFQVLFISILFTAAMLVFSDPITRFFVESGTSEDAVIIARYYITDRKSVV
jgi:Na+-driven multidrug efflux pump